MKADKELKLRTKRKKIIDKFERLDNDEETKFSKSKRAKRAGLIGRIFIVFVLALVFLFIVFNINYLTPSKMKEHMSAVFADMGSGEGFPYRFSADDILDFFDFSSSDTAVLTNNDLLILNSSANPVLSYKHSMSYPIVKSSRDRILLYDQGSSKAVMLNQSGQILSFPSDDRVICAHVSDSGKSAIAYRNDKNKEYVNVYAFSGKKLMSWEKGSGYIVDVCINPGGSLLSVAIIDTEDAVETINIYTFNISNAKQKGHTQIKSSVLYGLRFLSNNDICVLCNNKVGIYNSKCVLKADLDLPSANNLQLFTDTKGHIINAYTLYNNGKYCIDVYNRSLKKVYSKECDKDLLKVSSDGNTICALFSDKSADINMIGGKVSYRAKFDIDPITVLNRSKTVYACANGTVEKVKAVKQ